MLGDVFITVCGSDLEYQVKMFLGGTGGWRKWHGEKRHTL
jgi:hypothetical protein